ncbi:DUF7504 family protein [Salarchaeum japonicum]|uniref:Uncharacterized protein n=1 Tax=Salarchaeum japonicum TaxID=555573 RepID=A0AAV3T104_9EURY|nr:hypothetical protein [Salarchaeum japonicum]
MESDATRAESFAARLADLKRTGCAVLVRGDTRGTNGVCDRLLGDPSLDRRSVVVSTSDADRALTVRDGRDLSSDQFGVVDASGGEYTRSAVAASGSTAALPEPDAAQTWRTTVDDRTAFPDVLAAIDDHIDRLFPRDPGAGELRVCLHTLDALLDAVDGGETTEEDLFRFLQLLTARVRESDGILHAHVAAGIPERHLAVYEPLFDATIDAESRPGGGVRQKWRLHDSGLESAWLTLD